MTPRIAIIGVGNPDRGDDAAGHAVAAMFESTPFAGVEIFRLSGDAARLLDCCATYDAVFFVDASVSGAPAGTVQRFEAREDLPAGTAFGLSSHGCGLADAIALGKTLGALPPFSVVYAIEGVCFDMAAPMSLAILRGVEEAAARIRRDIQALQCSA